MTAMPISAWTDSEVRKTVASIEQMLLRDKRRGPVVLSQAPKTLRPRLKYLSSVATQLAALEREKAKYKDGLLPVGVREFIESPHYMAKKGVIWPRVIDEIEEACSGQYVEGVFTGGIGPLPGWTEVLTPSGWVRIDEWGGEEIAEYHAGDRTVHFRKPFDFVRRPATGWVRVHRPAFEMTVSRDHEVLLRGFSGALRTVDGQELLEQKTAKRASYSIPAAFSGGRAGVGLSEADLRLMVAVIADGNFHLNSKGHRCRITVRRERKKERLEQLLYDAGRTWSVTVSANRPTEECYWFDAPLKTKSWEWAWACSREQLEAIYDESPNWDGLYVGSEWRFHSTDKQSADFMQYVCHATGRRAALHEQARQAPRKNLFLVSAKTTEGPDYRLSKTLAEHIPPAEGEEEFCFTTSSGFFVVRQKGRVFVTGNCAKSTAALYIQAYLLYLLSRMKNPHEEFGLDPASEIVIIFQSIRSETAKTVEFDRFKEMIESAPYFQRHFKHDKELKTILRFPSRILVKPVSGEESAAIGQNVISAILDEVNFMAVVEKSKQASDGGVYNQAIALYNSIARRRESRFMQQGKVWGLLCLVSSARYPGQFTDKRKEARARQLAETGSTNIYVYDKRRWEVEDVNSPSYSYSGETFQLFLGDTTRTPRIMVPGEQIGLADRHLVMSVPIEHKASFQDDIYDAIRDVAGMATLATHPFIPYPEKVAACFDRVPSVLSRDSCDFKETKVAIYPKRIVNPNSPRFVHCDYSISGDSTGVAIGHVTGFEWVERAGGNKELLPRIRYDLLLEIQPPRGGQIEFENIRGLIYKLKELGMPIKWISFDQFNSHDSIMILRQKGFVTGRTSVDETAIPYEILKQAILDGRVECPAHQKCQYELVTLERDPQTGKVDHTEVSSKDVSDAMAGVAYGLTMRREIWMLAGIRPDQIPTSVKQAVIEGKVAVEGGISKR